MHLPFDDVRHSPDTRCNVNYFLFCGWRELWFIWNIQKQHSKWYTWTKSGKKCSETEQKRRWTGEVQDQEMDLYRTQVHWHWWHFSGLGFKVTVTDNIFRKCTFPAMVYQLAVFCQIPRSIYCIKSVCIVSVASDIAAVTTEQSPSTTHHHHHQQQQQHQLLTPTKSDRHVDELRQQHGVVKPFKSPRRKWLVAQLGIFMPLLIISRCVQAVQMCVCVCVFVCDRVLKVRFSHC